MSGPVFLVQQAGPDECSAIHTLVQTVADETFSHLFPGPHVPIGEEDWSQSWVAAASGQVVGVALTRAEYVTDLWVAADWRLRGVGASLLAQSENEIGTRGHSMARLRVVKSNPAVQFYLRCGWKIVCEFSHEKFSHAMFEMAKPVKQMGSQSAGCRTVGPPESPR
jgi:GNAT superfamily N-acetyltransferase